MEYTWLSIALAVLVTVSLFKFWRWVTAVATGMAVLAVLAIAVPWGDIRAVTDTIAKHPHGLGRVTSQAASDISELWLNATSATWTRLGQAWSEVRWSQHVAPRRRRAVPKGSARRL